MRAVVLACPPLTSASDDEPEVALLGPVPPALLPVVDRPALGHVVAALRAAGLAEVVVHSDGWDDVVDELTGEAVALRPLRLVEAEGEAPPVALRPEAAADALLLVRGDVLAAPALYAELLRAHEASGAGATLARAAAAGGLDIATVLAPDALATLGGVSLHEPLDDAPRRLQALGAEVHEYTLHEPVHVLDTVEGFRSACFAALRGELGSVLAGTVLDDGLTVGEGTSLDGVAMIEPPVWIGEGVEIGLNTQLRGPLVIGPGSAIGDGSIVAGAVVLPGATLPRETVLAGGVAGRAGPGEYDDDPLEA